jgi:alkylhydroperoxidase family enzyme
MRKATLLLLLSALPTWAADPLFKPVPGDKAWEQLPVKKPPLPAWARVLVTPLPKTTGAMLDLDRLHRAENPLGPVLAAKLRWIAADALGCKYSTREAETDLRRAGLTKEQVDEFTDPAKPYPDSEQALFKFARKLTKAAYTVTDDEFAMVLKQLGPEKITAVVHTVAFANFQFRIITALGVEPEPGSGVPPLPALLDPAARASVETPKRPEWSLLKTGPQPKVPTTFKWTEDGDGGTPDFFALMDKQKERVSRIPLPDKKLFADLPAQAKFQAENIYWMTVGMGYQPKMTETWFAAMRQFQSESGLNRVFANSVFWMVTRCNDCFY